MQMTSLISLSHSGTSGSAGRVVRPRRLALRARSAVAWAAAAWLALQIGLIVVIDQWLPELRDPEFGRKLALLREARYAEPDRPLVLLLGSSRTLFGVSPTTFEAGAADGDGREPLLFNFGVMGAGPITELSLFRQLLAEGIRPAGVLIEVNPLLLHQARGYSEESWIAAERLELRGLATFGRFAKHPLSMAWQWFAARMSSWHTYRLLFLERVAPAWVQAGQRQDRRTPTDGRGWLRHVPETISADERRTRLGWQFEAYAPSLEQYSISKPPDLALRELLDICRQEGILASLVAMPEASEMRAAFDPGAQHVLQAYLDDLSREYGVPLCDARTWAVDEEFVDLEHLLPAGAIRFSQRLPYGTEPFLADVSKRPADAKRSPAELAERPGAASARK